MLMRVTLASRMTALLGSATRPVSVAFGVWACRAPAKERTSMTATAATLPIRSVLLTGKSVTHQPIRRGGEVCTIRRGNAQKANRSRGQRRTPTPAPHAPVLGSRSPVPSPDETTARDPVWSKISNALKRLGFRSCNFLAQLLSETSRACTIRIRRSSLGRLWNDLGSRACLHHLWLANCYFAHDSLGFPALIPSCDATSDGSFHSLHFYSCPVAGSRRRPFPRC